MNLDNLIAQALMDSGVMHFPDEKLYKAATLLTPEERPNVPVRVVDIPQRGALKGRKIEAAVDMSNKTIGVNREGEQGYKSGNLQRLAGILAHEQEHMRRLKTDPLDFSEEPAYAKQYEVLKRLGAKDDGYLKAIKQQADRYALMSQMKK